MSARVRMGILRAILTAHARIIGLITSNGTPRPSIKWTGVYMARQGALTVGEKHHHAKMTDSEILDAKCLAAAGMSQSKIAEIYGCSKSSVSMILNDKRRPYRAEQQQA